jgi:hypothetical protein
MFDRDAVDCFMELVPDEIRVLRDQVAKGETLNAGSIWDRHRGLHEHLTELKQKCEEKGHPLMIALSGRAGTRRRLLTNSRNERRTCVMCGTEEVGTVVTGFLQRLLLRKTKWKFHSLNGQISRTFADPEWYFETLWVIRNFSFPTDVILQHAFPPQMPVLFRRTQGEG